jgi:hypothetical protein
MSDQVVYESIGALFDSVRLRIEQRCWDELIGFCYVRRGDSLIFFGSPEVKPADVLYDLEGTIRQGDIAVVIFVGFSGQEKDTHGYCFGAPYVEAVVAVERHIHKLVSGQTFAQIQHRNITPRELLTILIQSPALCREIERAA